MGKTSNNIYIFKKTREGKKPTALEAGHPYLFASWEGGVEKRGDLLPWLHDGSGE